MTRSRTWSSKAPAMVEKLAAVLPRDVHVVYRHATVPYLMLTDGLKVVFAVYIDEVCIQDGAKDVWYTPKSRVNPLHLVRSMEDWVEAKIDKGFECSVVCWMPSGVSKEVAPANILVGDADVVAEAFHEHLKEMPIFNASIANLKALIGIAIESGHEQAPAMLAQMMGFGPEAAIPDEQSEVFVELDGENASAPRSGSVEDVTLFQWTSKSSTNDNMVVWDMRRRMCEPMQLRGPDTIDRIDEIAATLYAESPWTRNAISALTDGMKEAVENGRHWLSFNPVIVVGPSGCGKSWLARRLAELAGSGVGGFDAASTTSLGPYVGVDSTWRGAMPSVAVSTIARLGIANPIIVIDEIDKSARSDETGNPAESLLPVLERSTAAKFWDSYLSGPVDLSYVNWILTANTLSRVPEPLRDRCSIIRIDRPQGAELEAFVRAACDRRGLDEEVAEMVVEGLENAGSPSLRSIVRAVEAADRASRRPMVN